MFGKKIIRNIIQIQTNFFYYYNNHNLSHYYILFFPCNGLYLQVTWSWLKSIKICARRALALKQSTCHVFIMPFFSGNFSIFIELYLWWLSRQHVLWSIVCSAALWYKFDRSFASSMEQYKCVCAICWITTTSNNIFVSKIERQFSSITNDHAIGDPQSDALSESIRIYELHAHASTTHLQHHDILTVI